MVNHVGLMASAKLGRVSDAGGHGDREGEFRCATPGPRSDAKPNTPDRQAQVQPAGVDPRLDLRLCVCSSWRVRSTWGSA